MCNLNYNLFRNIPNHIRSKNTSRRKNLKMMIRKHMFVTLYSSISIINIIQDFSSTVSTFIEGSWHVSDSIVQTLLSISFQCLNIYIRLSDKRRTLLKHGLRQNLSRFSSLNHLITQWSNRYPSMYIQ